MKTVGTLIKETREKLNVSQRELAKATKGTVSRSQISDVENGRSNFSVSKLNSILNALIRFGA